MPSTLDRHTGLRTRHRSRWLHRTAIGIAVIASITACGSDDVDDAAPVTTAGSGSTTAASTDGDAASTTTTTNSPTTTTVSSTAAPTTAASTTESTTAAPPPSTDAPSTTQAVERSFPDSMRGTWRESERGAVTSDQCRQDNTAVENFGKILSIRADGFTFFETGGRLLEVHERTDDRFEATFDTTYADRPTQDRLVFDLVEGGDAVTLSGGENVVSGPGTIRYARCPAATPLSAAEVEEFITSLGDWDPDISTYDPAAVLSAVQAVPPGAASAAALEQIFLFESGRYVGTPTTQPRIASSFEAIDESTLRLTYGHYASSDPFCCPSLDPWVVDVRWEGGSLVYDGDLPPRNQGLG